MSLPFQASFSPNCWHRVIDIMLEKQPENTSIHCMCILALLESDFNDQAVRIIIAWQVCFGMVDNDIIPSMQHGSGEGRHFISAVLNKQRTHDILHRIFIYLLFNYIYRTDYR
jgi:hypothetical protein